MAGIHQQRVAEQIRQILSELFLREMRDPRLQGLTVTEVTIDRELQFAEVYVHALGEEERQDEVMIALERAGGFLRREVGGVVNLRRTPELRFHWDPTFAQAEKIDRLLDNLDIPEEVSGEVYGDDSGEASGENGN